MVIALSFLVALPAWAKQDLRIDPDYDPRVELRIVVLPATKDRSLRTVNAETISALLATEMLREYQVIDLDRFRQFLTDKGLTLNDALSSLNEKIVRDSAKVDAFADIEVYLWNAGSGGIPLISSRKGQIGIRVRLMDPYTGRIYWSVNRLEKVAAGANFLDASTLVFRNLVSDVKKRLDLVAEKRNDDEASIELVAEGTPEPVPSKSKPLYTSSLRVEKGFVPSVAHKYGEDVLEPVKVPVSKSGQSSEMQGTTTTTQPDDRASLPPLFENSYEDVEPNAPKPPSLDEQRDFYLTPPELRQQETSSAAPPIPSRFQPDNELLPQLQLQPSAGETASPTDSTQGNPMGTGS